MDKVEKRIAFFRQVACELLEERAKLQDALKQIHTSGQLSLLTECMSRVNNLIVKVF